MPQNKRKVKFKPESIFETEYRLKREAKKIAANFIHTKPVKYLIK